MIVSNLLEQVDAMIPNSITAKLKLTWMNHIQNQLYRDYPTADAVYLFNVIANQKVYAFPNDCPEDRVKEVVIDTEKYTYLPLEEDVEAKSINFWTIANGQLVIHPTPKFNVDGYIFYRPRPVAMSVDQLGVEAPFPADFQELLVLGCASRVAKASNQLPLAQVFDADFIRLTERADLKLTKKKQETIIKLRAWS